MTKAELRAACRAGRAARTDDGLAAAGSAVVERVLALAEVRRAGVVLVTLSIRRELPTGPVIQALRAAGITVVVPFIEGPGVMTTRRFDGPTFAGAGGIPTSNGPELEPDVALCPGLAFDRRGGRLGFGAGFFDRFLAARPHVFRIGVGFADALVADVPVDAHDQPMHVVVTPDVAWRVP